MGASASLLFRAWPAIVAYAAVTIVTGVTSQAQVERFTPVTDAMLQNPAPEDWLMWRRTLDGWGYSPLDQVDRENVGELRMVWSRALTPGRQQQAPHWRTTASCTCRIREMSSKRSMPSRAIFGGSTGESFRTTSTSTSAGSRTSTATWPSTAISLSIPVTTATSTPSTRPLASSPGKPRSSTTRRTRPDIRRARSSPVARRSRDGAVARGRGPRRVSSSPTTPRPVPSCGAGGSCRHRASRGDETWGDGPYEERVHVGSWMVPSVDPELNLVYVGTSVTSPAPKFLRGGAENTHLYHNSTLALDADTGEIVWYYQHLNDHWDLDHPFERLLVDTPVAPNPATVSWINPGLRSGEMRKVITGIPGKTGVVYTLDRETGEFLWATPTITQNVISNIDGATGAVSENGELVFSREGQEVFVCPHARGGKDWEAGAYSPLTNTMYYPLRNTCSRMLATRQAGSHYALLVASPNCSGDRPSRHRAGDLRRDG